MGTVIMHNVVSVDGFIADAQDQVGPLSDWYVNGDVEIIDGGEIKVSQASADYVRTMWAGIGSMVIGRHLFDITNGWRAHRQRGITWSWCRTGPSPTIGTPRAQASGISGRSMPSICSKIRTQ
jgi:hypothetical protein